jgi:hypothetical protein
MYRQSNDRFDRDFDRDFNRMRNVFWVMFTLVTIVIVAVWVLVAAGIYTVVTNPEAIGNGVADVIRPIVETIKEPR